MPFAAECIHTDGEPDHPCRAVTCVRGGPATPRMHAQCWFPNVGGPMHVSAGDTAWMLVATALVFFMMPGLALFYGGLVGAKNVVATMAQSFVAIGVISLLWVIVGYSLAFGADHWGVIGSLQNVLLR